MATRASPRRRRSAASSSTTAPFLAPGQALHPRVFDDGDTASIAPSDAVRSGDPDVDDTASTASGGGPPDKRRRLDPDTLEVDVDGIAAARRQLERSPPALWQAQRLQFFNEFLQQIVQNSEPRDVDGLREILCRRMLCVYKRKAAIGRLYTSNTKTMPDGQDRRRAPSACAPRELRPFLCARLCRERHEECATAAAPAGGAAARMAPAASAARPPSSRTGAPTATRSSTTLPRSTRSPPTPSGGRTSKDAVELVISSSSAVCTKGGWGGAASTRRRRRRARPDCAAAARARRPSRGRVRLAPLGAPRRRAARAAAREGKKETDEEIDRSVFALIAQSEEDRILAAMRQAADAQGFQVLSLQFDGFFVREKPGRRLDLADVSMRIARDTGYAMEVVEKPLFSDVFPTLSLARADA